MFIFFLELFLLLHDVSEVNKDESSFFLDLKTKITGKTRISFAHSLL